MIKAVLQAAITLGVFREMSALPIASHFGAYLAASVGAERMAEASFRIGRAAFRFFVPEQVPLPEGRDIYFHPVPGGIRAGE